jgi:hypothetical protein
MWAAKVAVTKWFRIDALVEPPPQTDAGAKAAADKPGPLTRKAGRARMQKKKQ